MDDVAARFPDPNDQYLFFHKYFWNQVPNWLRDHRAFSRRQTHEMAMT